MHNTVPTHIDQLRCDKIDAIQRFLRQHGVSLCNLLDELDDVAGIDALCDLHAKLCVPYPDAGEVMSSLTDIKHILAAQSPASLDRIARERGFYATEAARWHGARIAELVARFPRSG
ncbi:hypothetical protein [Pararhodobacter oceanensis]|uniref:hypothetical protein n=1 Tax=Pararhodobacter oceanensis TaxID=2172121 RepID=UPI003A92CACF